MEGRRPPSRSRTEILDRKLKEWQLTQIYKEENIRKENTCMDLSMGRTHTHTHKHRHTNTHTQTHTNTHTQTHTQTHTHTNTHTHKHTHTNTHTTHTHTHKHTHTNTCMYYSNKVFKSFTLKLFAHYSSKTSV